MNEVDRNLSAAYVRAKDAGTLILVDRSGRVPRVLLGKRHAGHAFMPGKYVFPGGRVDRSDARVPVARPLAPELEALLMKRVPRPSPVKARALALSAIRETFEETGIMVGEPGTDPLLASKGAWSASIRAKVLPDLSALQLTGSMLGFSLLMQALDGVTGPDAELIEHVWMSLQQAARLDLPAVTRVMLEELDVRIAAGFRQNLPVPFYRMPRGRFLREIL
jgi:8-oxo-dGTP pyrophosphatase MutT (NUDIX family)